MLLRKLRKESGSVTIEATISLSAFMFAIVTILTIVNICIIQARISYAINTTAEEISQYSYLYALTGLNESHAAVDAAGHEDTLPLDNVFNDINAMYNEIEDLGDSGLASISDIDDISAKWENISNSLENLEDSGSALANDIEDIANNPKQIIFGVAKLAGSTILDTAKSKLIMEPLAKAMCKKHLVNSKNGNVDSYLKFLGVVPDATGSYYKGLKFNGSTLFPNGSNEIKVCVSYNVKVIALLPIDFSFHFEQTAITHGWLAGESTYVSDAAKGEKYVANDTLWTQAAPQERAEYIRNLAFKDLKSQGYYSLAYPYNTDGILYNPDSKEFIMPRSWNPFSGEESVSVDELNESIMKSYIEKLCGTLNSNEFGNNISIKKEKSDGSSVKEDVNCSGAKKKIVITIPEDEGLQEKIESVIAGCDTDGVEIELVPNYGNGASKSKVDGDDGGNE